MARGSGHEQEDDALGLRGVVRLLGDQGVDAPGSGLAEQAAQRDRAEADAALAEEPAAGNERRVGFSIEVILAVHWVRSVLSLPFRARGPNPASRVLILS